MVQGMSFSALFNERSAVEDDKYYVTADPARVDIELTQVEDTEQTPLSITQSQTAQPETQETAEFKPENTNKTEPDIQPEDKAQQNTLDKDQIKHLQLSQGGKAANAGLQNLNNAPDEVRGNTQQEKDKKDREFRNLLDRLKEHRLWLMGMMNQLQDDIDALTLKIEECGRVIDVLEDFKNGKIALGDDGYPDNERARKAIKEWERKNGKKWEPGTEEGMAAIDTIILSETKERNEYIKQRSDKQTEWNRWNDEWNATDEMINKYSDAQYANSSETHDIQNWVKQAEKLREIEELKQKQETLENTEGATAGVDTGNNALDTATGIFNSSPGIS